MKIKRYMGKDIQEAILKVKMDLGNDALILNTKKVPQKGFGKWFAKPMYEVLAAMDEQAMNKKNNANNLSKVEEKEEKIVELENKVNSMESLLHKIYNEMSTGEKALGENPVKNAQTVSSNGAMQIFYSNLIKNEVEPELAKKLVDSIKDKLDARSGVNEAASLLYNKVAGIMGKPQGLQVVNNGRPTVVIFVGPTGVGKTTTLAKIAASFTLNQKKNVGLITADTYRIAAVEQLKTYAEILGIPVSVIYSASEMKDAIKGYSDKDVVLIDTAGRSHRNKSQFEEIKVMVQASEADVVYLVLSATTSFGSCKEILGNYNFLSDYKLIFTKLDESPIPGLILNTRAITGKELSYFTTGQNVPDDIEVANIDKVTKSLLGSVH